MISTLVIPNRTIPCSQRMPFKSDNEPVFNSAPEVDESGDTFLKRLQRSKLQSPNDSCMPSGHEFCFEAVVNKRYNRWKRSRRKKTLSTDSRSSCLAAAALMKMTKETLL
ncbi:hypothetical protein DPMN_047514 [Dreissena polymorpha]|uniref:Uncharacterized protein n=1 Tax=Dreissena polymorpha TaxID=45954 RepID=A0A9D4D870_DREPO|nr:hypothetical protein DPMN_047514 [Dreissena polymorpha]